MATTGDMPRRQPEDDERSISSSARCSRSSIDRGRSPTLRWMTFAQGSEPVGSWWPTTDPPHRYTKGVTLTAELFDAIEDNAAGRQPQAGGGADEPSGSPGTAGGMTRAEAHRRAGEQWLLADDPADAVHQFAGDRGHRADSDPESTAGSRDVRARRGR